MHAVTKTIILFTFAHFSHHVLTAIVTPLLPFMRREFGLSYAQAGVVLSAVSRSSGFGQLPAGWLADRIGPKCILPAGIAGVGAAGILVGLSGGYVTLLLSLLVMGLAGGGYHPAASPLITAAVEKEKRGQALGIHVIGGSASHFAGPLIAAAMAGLLGWRGAFLGLSVPVMLLGLYFYKAYGTGRTAAGFEDREKSDGVREKLSGNLLVELVAVVVLVTMTGSTLTAVASFVPLYMVDGFGASEATAAVSLSIFYAGGLLAAPAAGRLSDRIGRRRVIAASAILGAAGIMLLPSLSAGFGFSLLFFGLGAMMFSRMPPGEAHIIGLTPKHLRSTVMGIYYFAGMEGSGILTPLLGFLIDARGCKQAFFSMGAGLAVVAALCITVIFAADRRKRAAAATAAP